jgi:hypothetical protein
MGIKNIKYLVELYGGAQSYTKCSSNKIRKTMDEFADKKLKDRGGRVVTNKKQAIAIALSQADAKCQYNPQEVKMLITKVNEELNSPKDINLSNVIETKKAIGMLKSQSKPKQIYRFKKLLFDKVIATHLDGKSLSKNIWEEIYQIQKN